MLSIVQVGLGEFGKARGDLLAGCRQNLLKIFDLLGRQLETLVEGDLLPGNYVVEWDATGLPSGVYLYALTWNGRTEFRRMMVVK